MFLCLDVRFSITNVDCKCIWMNEASNAWTAYLFFSLAFACTLVGVPHWDGRWPHGVRRRLSVFMPFLKRFLLHIIKSTENRPRRRACVFVHIGVGLIWRARWSSRCCSRVPFSWRRPAFLGAIIEKTAMLHLITLQETSNELSYASKGYVVADICLAKVILNFGDFNHNIHTY